MQVVKKLVTGAFLASLSLAAIVVGAMAVRAWQNEDAGITCAAFFGGGTADAGNGLIDGGIAPTDAGTSSFGTSSVVVNSIFAGLCSSDAFPPGGGGGADAGIGSVDAGATGGGPINPLPNVQLAVGLLQVVETANTRYAVFDKTTGTNLTQTPGGGLSDAGGGALADAGSSAGADSVDGATLFAPVLTPGATVSGLSVHYDAGRFVFTGLAQQTSGALVLFAVSNGEDATASFTQVHAISLAPNTFSNEVRFGYNADVYVLALDTVTVDPGSSSTSTSNNIIFIPKSGVLSSDPAAFAFQYFTDPSLNPSAESGIMPATTRDSSHGGPCYLARASPTGDNIIDVIRISSPGTPNAIVDIFPLVVTSYEAPPPIEQPGSVTLVSGFGSSLRALAGDGTRFIAVHTVGSTADGLAHVRSYEFDTSTTPALVGSNELNPGPGVYTYAPSIETNASGLIALTYLESSSSEFLSMYVTGKGWRAQTFRPAVLIQAGRAPFLASSSPPPVSDRSGMAVDPANNVGFWAGNEFATSGPPPNWGTAIASVSIPPIPGDLNSDDLVNCADMNIVKVSFGAVAGQSRFNPVADVVKDGVINVRDLAYVAQRLPSGTVCH